MDAVGTMPAKSAYKRQFVWKMVFTMLVLHIVGVYGWYVKLTQTKMATIFFAYFYAWVVGMGVTAGAHRLWSHRSYKASWQARLILMLCHTAALQNNLFDWVRDHRVHHKFSETDADPHNASRGFFFSHVGWLMMKKHPDVLSKGKTVDMSDVAADPIVAWQRKYYWYMVPWLTFILPGLAPWYFWGENFWVSMLVPGIGRYVTSLNYTWLVNSAAHMWGSKPYDKNIGPVQNIPVAILTYGEGYHNYHHTFPWDYKADELGRYHLNVSTALIDFFALIGWAYDLKMVSVDLARRRAKRTGDGSHRPVKDRGAHRGDLDEVESEDKKNIWGWGDVDMTQTDVVGANICWPRRTPAVK